MAPSKRKHATKQSCVIPGGYTVLTLKFGAASAAPHKLCIKEHKVRAQRSPHRPLDRTLFVLNVPPYCSEEVVKTLFSEFGVVQAVELRDEPGTSAPPKAKVASGFVEPGKRGFKVGYIVFESREGVLAAKSHPHDVPLVVSTEERPIKTGVQKWIEQYKTSFIHPKSLQQTVDSFMSGYDKRKEEEAVRLKEEAEKQQEDAEGWVKVTRGNKGAKARPHSEAANQKVIQREMRKKRRKELLNFYSWQHKNTQKEHIAELRKKFEEDKQKIALLRAQRKFRPY